VGCIVGIGAFEVVRSSSVCRGFFPVFWRVVLVMPKRLGFTGSFRVMLSGVGIAVGSTLSQLRWRSFLDG
jgi:hypothetical protein